MGNLKNPVKAIRAFCVECMGGNATYVKECTTETCPLHPFRNGKNPYRTRQLTDEQRQAAAERLRAARERKTKEAQHE